MEAQISVEFEEATSRQSLNSGETINTLWGKVKRWLSDLKVVCFSGSYNDLSDTPTTATKDTDGLMSAEDKSKLDGVATGANKTIVDTILSNTSTNPVQNKIVKQAIDNKADKSLYGDTTINVGRKAETNVGEYSTAEGYNTTANGKYSHSEGEVTTASGEGSHAEGISTKATGRDSHAEGAGSVASGSDSHAGGNSSIASGLVSFSHGIQTLAQSVAEVAFGKYNVSDGRLFSIGDGTADDARHNAFEVTTTGGKLHDKDIATTDLIPTSLPANGGNADTVGGKSASDFVEALTVQQTNYTRILIPDNVDVRSWLMENAKIGTVYYVTSECQGQINLPPMTVYGWAWFIFDGIRYIGKVMVSDVSARYYLLDNVNIPGDWKEISTTPIKKISFPSVATNAGGGGTLFSADFGTPITIACTSRVDTQCTPFFASNQWLVLAKDAVTLDPIPAGSYSFDIWYI